MKGNTSTFLARGKKSFVYSTSGLHLYLTSDAAAKTTIPLLIKNENEGSWCFSELPNLLRQTSLGHFPARRHSYFVDVSSYLLGFTLFLSFNVFRKPLCNFKVQTFKIIRNLKISFTMSCNKKSEMVTLRPLSEVCYEFILSD